MTSLCLFLSVYAKFREPVPIPDFISYPIGNRFKLEFDHFRYGCMAN